MGEMMLLPPERILSVNEFPSCREENVIARTHGLRYTLRDMGNGVIRVENPVLDPKEFLERDAERHGRYRLTEYPWWSMDGAAQAIDAIGGLPCTDTDRMVSFVYVTPIRPGLIQVMGWRHPAFFK